VRHFASGYGSRAPKKGRGPGRALDRHGSVAPPRLSAPSARDRGLAGVPFASSRLPSWSGRAGSALTHTASAQNADPNDLPLLLRDSEDWRSEAAGENDREPEPPHGKRA